VPTLVDTGVVTAAIGPGPINQAALAEVVLTLDSVNALAVAAADTSTPDEDAVPAGNTLEVAVAIELDTNVAGADTVVVATAATAVALVAALVTALVTFSVMLRVLVLKLALPT
jgi:hypothetical protein